MMLWRSLDNATLTRLLRAAAQHLAKGKPQPVKPAKTPAE